MPPSLPCLSRFGSRTRTYYYLERSPSLASSAHHLIPRKLIRYGPKCPRTAATPAPVPITPRIPGMSPYYPWQINANPCAKIGKSLMKSRQHYPGRATSPLSPKPALNRCWPCPPPLSLRGPSSSAPQAPRRAETLKIPRQALPFDLRTLANSTSPSSTPTMTSRAQSTPCYGSLTRSL